MHTVSHPVTGVILAGGKSRRMGHDKAFLAIDGLPLVERVLRLFTDTFAAVIIVGGQAERFAPYRLAVYPDLYPGSALGGLYTGLYHATTPYIFVAPCDIPFPSRVVMKHLLAQAEGYDVVVAQTGHGFEPLFAVYGKTCLEPIRRMLEEGNFCIYDLYPQVRTRSVSEDELAGLVDGESAFMNLNTPDDLAQLKNKKGRNHPMTTKAVSFVAKSGTGKTTLLEKVISELKGRGYRVGVIKHDAHRFDIDHPGKDSHRLTAAGADTMLISSPEKLAVIKKHAASPPIEDLIATYFGDVDIVLTEGFKMSGMPKIEVHRRERSNTLLCRGEHNDPTLVAVASDSPLELDVPVLALNDPVAVADFIVARFLV